MHNREELSIKTSQFNKGIASIITFLEASKSASCTSEMLFLGGDANLQLLNSMPEKTAF